MCCIHEEFWVIAVFHEGHSGGWGESQKPIHIISNCTKSLLSTIFGCITIHELVSLCDISFTIDQKQS